MPGATSAAKAPANATQAAATYADIVHASYADSVTTAQELDSAAKALVATPSEATLNVARNTWKDAREPYLQTEVKDAVRQLRAALSQDDRDLLTLRIDRELPWKEIAHVLIDETEVSSDADIARFEAALRHRFSEVKKRLRRLAMDAGLL